mmetsp:Transcript_37178/g.119517  ORF Transcript_37178/g.119517 Transcript_37178/m.119517 type:complete len:341 (+) Transcript_37178:954-1976(+)|eukprot:scaffold28066_cov119-Isochrysis_galbana.AAC.2
MTIRGRCSRMQPGEARAGGTPLPRRGAAGSVCADSVEVAEEVVELVLHVFNAVRALPIGLALEAGAAQPGRGRTGRRVRTGGPHQPGGWQPGREQRVLVARLVFDGRRVAARASRGSLVGGGLGAVLGSGGGGAPAPHCAGHLLGQLALALALGRVHSLVLVPEQRDGPADRKRVVARLARPHARWVGRELNIAGDRVADKRLLVGAPLAQRRQWGGQQRRQEQRGACRFGAGREGRRGERRRARECAQQRRCDGREGGRAAREQVRGAKGGQRVRHARGERRRQCRVIGSARRATAAQVVQKVAVARAPRRVPGSGQRKRRQRAGRRLARRRCLGRLAP